MELLSWRSVKDISGDGGVIKTVTAEGSGWDTCRDAYEAVVAYSARLAGTAGPGRTHCVRQVHVVRRLVS